MSRERERIRKLAKALSVIEGMNTVIWGNEDGTFGFSVESEARDKTIIEYITPY